MRSNLLVNVRTQSIIMSNSVKLILLYNWMVFFGAENNQFFIWILLEYVRSLTDYSIPVQHCIHELLINTLVLNKCFHQLHQILQYHVISDSKPLVSNTLGCSKQLSWKQNFKFSRIVEQN